MAGGIVLFRDRVVLFGHSTQERRYSSTRGTCKKTWFLLLGFPVICGILLSSEPSSLVVLEIIRLLSSPKGTPGLNILISMFCFL